MAFPQRMTEDQIKEIVEDARKDEELWQQLIDRELEIAKMLADAARQGLNYDDSDVVLDPPSFPTLTAIIEELLVKKFGSDHGYFNMPLVTEIRRNTCQDLGLPTSRVSRSSSRGWIGGLALTAKALGSLIRRRR